MRSNFINIGNQTFADASKIKYIIAADYNKVARLLSKYGVKRDDLRVFDTTSNKSTRSFLVLDDGTFGISSVSAKILCSRANGVERIPKEKDTVTEETVNEDGNDVEEATYGYYEEKYVDASPNDDT